MPKKKDTSNKTENEEQENIIIPKILIIDDEELLRKSIKKLLERAGFYCDTALDFDSAKDCINTSNYDLCLVDIVLPKMSGLQMVKKLQQECDLDSAIIFITGEPSLETSIEAIRLGATDYLEKPVDRKNLIEAILKSLILRKKVFNILDKKDKKTILVNGSLISSQSDAFDPDLIQKLELCLNNTHGALFQLKKKFGEEFNEEERSLMNIIAQNNSQMKKVFKKYIIQ